VCIPGSHQCNGDQIETCGAGGTWGADTDCAAGVCQYTNNDATCIAQCIPGKKLCLGSNVTVPDVGITATDSEGTCTATGTYPTPTTCGAGTYCRRGPSAEAGQNFSGDPGDGTPLGCVVCVGGQNEFGLRDTKCGDDAGTGTGNFLTTCLANSSGWDGANNVQCTGNTPTCNGPSLDTAPPSTSGVYCHGVFIFDPVTETSLDNYCAVAGCGPKPPGGYCAFVGPGGSGPCPTSDGGSVPDCCNGQCYADPSPGPAYCGN
jgi:hypothetical protein